MCNSEFLRLDRASGKRGFDAYVLIFLKSVGLKLRRWAGGDYAEFAREQNNNWLEQEFKFSSVKEAMEQAEVMKPWLGYFVAAHKQ